MKSSLSLKTKILLLVILPLLFLSGFVAVIGAQVEREFKAEQERILQAGINDSKKKELKFLLNLAFAAVKPIMERKDLSREEKQAAVKRMFNEELFFDKDGYFYVYDRQGVNIVHPQQKELVGKPQLAKQDSRGVHMVRDLLREADQGKNADVVYYRWKQTSTDQEEDKVGYAQWLPGDWGWMVGTGLYDVQSDVGDSLDEVRKNVEDTFERILLLLALTMLAIMLLVWWVNLHESRVADRHLRELVHNFIHLQVEERRRFAHELHDGINQLIGAAKFRIELAARQLTKGKGDYQESLGKAQKTLEECMGEVRRISHGLRPGLLDEMGLDAAMKRLLEEFAGRTGIQVDTQLQIDQADMPDDAAIMLYRVLQEALTNIERHAANARHVTVQLRQERHEAMLAINDDGHGFAPDNLPSGKGIGLKNMRERMELLDGSCQIESAIGHGTRIQARVPL